MEDFPSQGSTLAALLALLADTVKRLDLASHENEAPGPGRHTVPGPGWVGMRESSS